MLRDRSEYDYSSINVNMTLEVNHYLKNGGSFWMIKNLLEKIMVKLKVQFPTRTKL